MRLPFYRSVLRCIASAVASTIACATCARNTEGNAMSLQQAHKEGSGGGDGKEEIDISFDADFWGDIY